MCIFKAFDKMKRLNFAMKIALKIGLCHFKIKKSKKLWGEAFPISRPSPVGKGRAGHPPHIPPP